ncbi:MAG TPA: 6-carboxytetrahydropterin synthase [Candidatus Limnocylindria bacterium]|nr:6-carboxytetrahydropterin synthase [Candidatus Limnocylindria bacterium]
MYEVGIVARFAADHRLRGDFGPASKLHRHKYRVELLVAGERLAADGTLVDIGLLQTALGRCVGELDGRTLNELPQFGERNSTAEQVAAWLADAVAVSLPRGLAAMTVRVFESPDAWASVRRDLSG